MRAVIWRLGAGCKHSHRRVAPALLACTVVSVAMLAMSDMASAAPRVARFWARAEGVQSITWNEPEHQVHSDCFSVQYRSAQGAERTTFTGQRTKLLATRSGYPSRLYLAMNEWGVGAVPWPFMLAQMSISRSAEMLSRTTPGKCGGHGSEHAGGPYDCGTHQGKVGVAVGVDGESRVTLGVGSDPRYPAPHGFNTCPMVAPFDVTPAGFTAIPGTHVTRLIAADVFNPRVRTIRLSGSRSFHRVYGGLTVSDARVEWKLTLTRAGR